MPTTNSSKLDRKAISQLPLEEDNIELGFDESNQPELTETEERLKEIWFEVVKETFKTSHPIVAETDFFHVGGTSLLLLSLRTAIWQSFNARLRVIDLIEASTLGDMARVIHDKAPHLESVNWEEETRPSKNIQQLYDTLGKAIPHDEERVIILTGSTGFLGRAILRTLVDDQTVAKVHCIAVRGDTNNHREPNTTDDSKVCTHNGDLTAPRLGLSVDDARQIFSDADCIIHCGAQVSHSQSYRSLRLPNLQSTKELINMCGLSGRRRVPVHYLSTAQVGVFYAESTGRHEFPEVSLAACEPPREPGSFEGYPATKWASERFLERLHGQSAPSGWPVVIHRPAMISRAEDFDASERERDVIGSIRKYSSLMAAVPTVPDHFRGFLDSVALEDVVAGVVDAVKAPRTSEPGVRFRHYFGKESLQLDSDFMVAQALSLDDGSRNGRVVVEELPLAEWVKRASELGLHPHVAKWIEAIAVARTQVYPKITH
ncbi:AMP-binding enzyme [Apiospora aurea]|uniref:AMP-binding enzyme n=1 Tax=Apiospora aurea TaxID=335848 RepID=A0ABR1Q2S7_9PEZI